VKFVYLRPRVLLQGALGFSGGIPYMLTASTLAAWMSNAGVALGDIGLFSLVSLPYSFKFLWAPLLDRFTPGVLGRRRGWILVGQLGLVVAIALLGATDPARAPTTTALAAVAVAFLSATQDIAIDAYRTDVLRADERAAGSAMYVFGYRAAMVVSGALALRLADWLHDWRLVHLLMAAAILPTIPATLLAPPEPAVEQPRRFTDVVVAPLVEFFRRRGSIVVLAFITLYRLTDLVLVSMVPPFLLGHGYTNSEVADATKLLGMMASIAGALGGGALVARFGLFKCLFAFGLLQAATNLGYFALASTERDLALLWAAVGVDNLCSGLAIAASTAYLMAQCDRRFSATQFALLTSAAGLGGRLLGGVAGLVAEAVGWPSFFLLTTALGAPALVLFPWLGRRTDNGE
jgi:PAT family beta-lactamase induction signal transducer AmpG